MRFHKRFRDGQAQSCSSGRRPRNLYELVEDMRQVFRRDAASGITDRHGHVVIAALGADLDFASLRAADGIDDEVANDALNLCAINLDLR